jgi:branched-chain amino acid transport system permease protein
VSRLLETRRGDAAGAISLAVIAIGLPFAVESRFYQSLLFLVMLNGGLASSWNILGGFAGQFSLGHTAFVGIGAYASTLLYTMAGVSPWLGMLAGGCVSMLLAVVVSYPVFRLRGVFFAMATIAIGETVRILLLWARRKASIPYGLSINFEPRLSNMIFAGPRGYALLAAGFLLVVVATSYAISRSWIGAYLRALRDNEEAAAASGVDVRRYKLLTLLVSVFFTSIGGSILAQYVLYIEPATVFSTSISVNIALMAILGGLGTLLGPLIGAALALPLEEFLRDALGSAAAGAHLAAYGIALVLIVMLMPDGLHGAIRAVARRLGSPRRVAPALGGDR